MISMLLSFLLSAHSIQDAPLRVVEPKKISAAKQLKPGEGALRLSVRAQRQYIDTLFVYFVRLDEQGADTRSVLRFERGAGVPLMGTNMIDPKPTIYRVPAGRYRLLSFTVKCQEVPMADGMCSGGLGESTPAHHYGLGSPSFEVTANAFTDAGDFIAEYVGAVPPEGFKPFDVKLQDLAYEMRWRSLAAPVPAAFAALASAGAVAAEPAYQSRIVCPVRPVGITLYIPFTC